MKPSLQFRILQALYGKRRPRTVDEIFEFLQTESPGPPVTRRKVHAHLRTLSYMGKIRWLESYNGYLRNRTKYGKNVGKPWSGADNRLVAELFHRRTPLRIAALKLRRMEEEIVRHHPVYAKVK